MQPPSIHATGDRRGTQSEREQLSASDDAALAVGERRDSMVTDEFVSHRETKASMRPDSPPLSRARAPRDPAP
jgi:hypothetical protein